MTKSHGRALTGLSLLAILIAIVVGCAEAPIGPTQELGTFEFPLAIGNSWDYSLSRTRVDSDTNGVFLTSVTTIVGGSSSRVVEVVVLPESPPTFALHTTWQDGEVSGERDDSYENQADGFYLTGYTGDSWIGPPKLVPGSVYYEFKGVRSSSLRELTDYFIQSRTRTALHKPTDLTDDPGLPVREWAYPLEVESQWLYRDTLNGDAFNIQKTITGQKTVKVRAGTFACYEIEWLWDLDHDGVWDTDIGGHDYISEVGTVRRQFRFLGIVQRGYELDIVGYFDFIEDYTLMEYEVQ